MAKKGLFGGIGEFIGKLFGGGKKPPSKPPSPPPPPPPPPKPPPPPPPIGGHGGYGPEEGDEDEDEPEEGDEDEEGQWYYVGKLSDTQIYSRYRPDQLRWPAGFQTFDEAKKYIDGYPIIVDIFKRRDGLYQLAVMGSDPKFKKNKAA